MIERAATYSELTRTLYATYRAEGLTRKRLEVSLTASYDGVLIGTTGFGGISGVDAVTYAALLTRAAADATAIERDLIENEDTQATLKSWTLKAAVA